MERMCDVPGCGRKHWAQGYCRAHYLRVRRYGRTERVNASLGRDAVCSVKGCEKPQHAKGYCATHYARVRATGRPGSAEMIVQKNRSSKYKGVQCSIPGCDRPAKAKTWCEMHYQRWHKSGRENGGDPVGKWGANPRKSEGHWGTDGYFRVRVGKKIRLQHHLVMEEMLGRPLEPHENVHHKNGRRGDNRPENLELWMKPQPKGVRVDDMVAFIVDHYREEVLKRLSEGDDGSGAVLA